MILSAVIFCYINPTIKQRILSDDKGTVEHKPVPVLIKVNGTYHQFALTVCYHYMYPQKQRGLP